MCVCVYCIYKQTEYVLVLLPLSYLQAFCAFNILHGNFLTRLINTFSCPVTPMMKKKAFSIGTTLSPVWAASVTTTITFTTPACPGVPGPRGDARQQSGRTWQRGVCDIICESLLACVHVVERTPLLDNCRQAYWARGSHLEDTNFDYCAPCPGCIAMEASTQEM